MDSNSSASGEKLNIKTRKPYTITKQRERWTEDEHNNFLEALKLYGRAWQRIEEHIGTKTAVQIRSHAQKFFTKLEKEAVAKGVPISQAVDIEIPPPRPKRKPNYPYPRKTDPNTQAQLAQKDDKQTTLASSLQLLDPERKPLPEDKEKLEKEKTSEQVQNGTTEGSQEAPYLENDNSIPNESHFTIETRKHQEVDQNGIKKNTDITSDNSLFESSHENIFHGPCSDMQGVRTCPRHVPVQLVDVNKVITTSVPPKTSHHESEVNNLGEVYEHSNPNVSVNISAASETSGHHNNATFHPLFNGCNDTNESYRSFLHFSSTISSFIVSSLLQNPAAHAAANFAAKYWHPVNTEAASADCFSRDRLNPETTTSPSMAAIAAATVAAATAWWSAHGLLPACTPFYQGCYSRTFGTPVDNYLANSGRDKAASEGVMREKKMDVEKVESADDLSSSDDSEKKLNNEVIPVDTNGKVPVVESSKLTNGGKQVDRSSCGSNTTSSSEIEMGVLEKHGKETEETKALDVKESISRRGRSIITPNESWKEVSQEGRLAFQALFSREVLPQSFSNPHSIADNGQQIIFNNSDLDLNRMSQELGDSTSNGLRTGSGCVKLNHNRTGFKPYKRCSIEAKESSKIVSAGKQNDENGPKRMRLEAEAST